ncbi:MAG: PD40 domain-containing protein [Bacteroidia bacterium]|nr:PD40 domain-containing protein [Bacteroidia bacterium]
MLKRSYILFVLLFTGTFLFGQSKENKKQVKELLKEAQLSFDIEDHLNAWNSYRHVLVLDPKNEKASVNSAISFFKLSYSLDSAQFFMQGLSSSTLVDAKYYLAKIKHQQKNFDEAIQLLNDYNKQSPKKRLHTIEETNYMIGVCESAKELISKPHRSIIKNMGPEINSTYADYVPVIVPDENTLYFTSRREGSSNNKKDVYGNYYEDVYVSVKEKGVWTKAENVKTPINSETNDACVAISPDGQSMIVYRTSSDQVTGDLYITKLGSDNKWEPLQKMAKEINSQFIETSACFSIDTSQLYFSSNRPGGYGGKDIYRIKKLPNGRWALPFNLGPNINTLYDEDSPYLHPDNITMYYSSKGHNTMGEYDVFKSILNPETNQFSKAENLGYPINNIGNDIFFVLSVDGQRGYYSSLKEETIGNNDIYQIDTRFGDNDLKVKHGVAFKDDMPAKVKITLLDNEGNAVNGTYNSNPKTGKFILVMNPLKSYKAIVEAEGYTTLVVDIDPLAFEKVDKDLEFKIVKK